MPSGPVTRTMLSGIFIVAGAAAVKEPGGRPVAAQRLMKRFNIELDDARATALVRINGATMVAAGGTLALGVFPRLSALTLIGSLVPTTLAGHAFWEDEDESKRQANQIQLLKNLGLVAGLINVVLQRKNTK